MNSDVEQVDKVGKVDQLLSELEAMESQLQMLRNGLLRSQRLATLGTLAAAVAHEYNNILSPVITYCDLALSSEDDIALMTKAVERARSAAQRATQMGDSVLGFARDNATTGSADLRSCVDEVFACIGRPPEKDGIQLHIDIPAECQVGINPVHLEQVLMNLVLNAQRAMKSQGGGSLQIRAMRDTAERMAFIEIADTGPGIPPKVLENLWEPFLSIEPTDSAESSRGTGLGMTISRNLIERAEGKIDVVRSDGEGTVFAIQLPLDSAD